ncbi:MAG: pantoate--beta-alanine ligase [Blastopirellula sp.]|nr:MAG: pantoate--beta-alanine ligase [Blastopirellula sp.]
MKIIRRKSDLRILTRNWHRAGKSIGVVPTMGALHAGHLSLVEAAHSRADRVIVTLFVNPRQFNKAEDLKKYPRTEESDAQKLVPLGVDVLYVPKPEEIYPDGFATTVSVSGVSAGLCGATRPGHFDGVATVVTKLLLQTDADCAFFGEKDYQQLQVIKRLAIDLDLKVEIVGCPTIREADGLAMSSRNLRLNSTARDIAPVIKKVLSEAATDIERGQSVRLAVGSARNGLIEAGLDSIDYLELRRASDLAPLETSCESGRLLVAAWLQGVRLIDNVPVGISSLSGAKHRLTVQSN